MARVLTIRYLNIELCILTMAELPRAFTFRAGIWSTISKKIFVMSNLGTKKQIHFRTQVSYGNTEIYFKCHSWDCFLPWLWRQDQGALTLSFLGINIIQYYLINIIRRHPIKRGYPTLFIQHILLATWSQFFDLKAKQCFWRKHFPEERKMFCPEDFSPVPAHVVFTAPLSTSPAVVTGMPFCCACPCNAVCLNSVPQVSVIRSNLMSLDGNPWTVTE